MASIVSSVAPLLYFVLSLCFAMVALNLRPSRRPAFLAPIFAFAVSSFQSITLVSPSLDYAHVLGLFVLIWLSHISSVLCLEKYVLPRVKSSDAVVALGLGAEAT